MGKTLIVIPARGGSKGIPHKNRRSLAGRPLIAYSIQTALDIATPDDICISTDDPEIAQIAEDMGVKVPFLRPAELASDTAGSYEVLLHAVNFYEQMGRHYDTLLLLQPTSPLRTTQHVREAIELYKPGIDMVVSVQPTKTNPFYNCFKENAEGYMEPLLANNLTRRQDAPTVYEYNGAIYFINIESLKKMPLGKMKHIVKYVMDDISSVDLDTQLDWQIAEFLLKNNQ